MVFSSAVFLFCFLPVLYLIYRIVPGMKAKNAVLLLFSLLFYCFGDLTHLPLLLLSIIVSWAAGRLLGHIPKESKSKRRLVLAAAVVYHLGMLAVFKYADFFTGNFNTVFHTAFVLPGLGLPLGISFFTFTSLSYVIEVYRKPANMAGSLFRTALYISLLTNILSGPILSWKTAAPQLEERSCTADKTAVGIRRFIIGLSKKLLIADIVGGGVDAIFAAGIVDARLGWLGAIGYGVQIYFDFSGYSDMALGLAGVFGFEFPENFNQPYIASSMTDYWKRWHISLTTWFRNYLYMPLVMSRPLTKLYKKWAARYGRAKANRLAIIIPSIIVWLLTGLWHGADWTYVIWGIWEGLFCILEGVKLLRPDEFRGRAGRIAAHVYTILVVLVGNVLFRAGSLNKAGDLLLSMIAGWRFSAEATLLLQTYFQPLTWFCLIIGIIGCLPVVPQLKKCCGIRGEPVSYVVCTVLLVLCIMNMAVTGFQPFIYLQF